MLSDGRGRFCSPLLKDLFYLWPQYHERGDKSRQGLLGAFYSYYAKAVETVVRQRTGRANCTTTSQSGAALEGLRNGEPPQKGGTQGWALAGSV